MTQAKPGLPGRAAGADRRPSRGLLAILFALAILPLQAAAAPAADLHAWWDQRCGECHGHAAAFAREFLLVRDGVLLGRHHGAGLRAFLANHGVPPDEVEPVYAMLLAQASTEPRFAERCGGCHGSAADFARTALERRDGVLVGRRTGRPVQQFLGGHAGLGPDEVPFFIELLGRVEQEVHGP